MMNSTIIHHICVAVGYIYIVNSNFSNEGIFKGITIYGAFSSLAFPVNLYLGYRFLLETNSFSTFILRKISFINYLISVSINWSWQSFYFIKLLILYYNKNDLTFIPLFSLFIYFLLLYNWIKDDLVLLSFLNKKNINKNKLI